MVWPSPNICDWGNSDPEAGWSVTATCRWVSQPLLSCLHWTGVLSWERLKGRHGLVAVPAEPQIQGLD